MATSMMDLPHKFACHLHAIAAADRSGNAPFPQQHNSSSFSSTTFFSQPYLASSPSPPPSLSPSLPPLSLSLLLYFFVFPFCFSFPLVSLFFLSVVTSGGGGRGRGMELIAKLQDKC